MNIQWFLMAAGSSTRFGNEDKLLYPFNHRPLIELSLAPFIKGNMQPIIVISRDNEQLEKYLSKRNFSTLLVDDADKGLGANIKKCIATLSKTTHFAIALADMPNITTRTLFSLEDAINNHYLIASCINAGCHSPPAIFNASMQQDLLHIDDHKGANLLIKKFKHRGAFIACERSELVDIDTLADARQYGMI